MKSTIELVKNNPAVVLSLLVALFGVAAAFGFELTKEQTGSITALVTVLVGFLIRSQVTPTRSVGALTDDAPGNTNGDLMAGPASDVPTGDPVDVVPADELNTGISRLDYYDGVGRHRPEGGAIETGSLLFALACIVIILCGVVFLVRAF